MVDCKNCLHYMVCESNTKGSLILPRVSMFFYKGVAKCFYFTDKFEYIHLPCKVRDYLYTNSTMQGWYMRKRNAPYRVKVVFVGLNGSENQGGGFLNVLYENGGMLGFYFSDIGKTIFFTY